jgi:hypothetical protein
LLKEYQQKLLGDLKDQLQKEKDTLDNRVRLREEQHKQRVYEESTRLQGIRLERQQELKQRHLAELQEFDESPGSGFVLGVNRVQSNSKSQREPATFAPP